MAFYQDSERVVLGVDDVTVRFEPGVLSIPNNRVCRVALLHSKVQVECEGATYTLPFRCIKSIDIHQPIFGANYITVDYVAQGAGGRFTLTFSKGGATDFARTFFQLTEGHLESDEPIAGRQGTQEEPPSTAAVQTEDKKNR